MNKKKINQITMIRLCAIIFSLIDIVCSIIVLFVMIIPSKKEENVKTVEIVEICPTIATEQTEPVDTEPTTMPTEEIITEPTLPEVPEEYKPIYAVKRELEKEGFNNYAIAGIIGNMMCECGGCTLKLNTNIYDSSHSFYGICQWSLYYYPEVSGKSIDEQIEFLLNTIEKEFDTFGNMFGFTYEGFKSIGNERDAALAFARIYERCASFSYGVRQKCATEVYEFFMNNEFSY